MRFTAALVIATAASAAAFSSPATPAARIANVRWHEKAKLWRKSEESSTCCIGFESAGTNRPPVGVVVESDLHPKIPPASEIVDDDYMELDFPTRMFTIDLAYLVQFSSSKLTCYFKNPFYINVFSLHLCLRAFSFTPLGESDLSGRCYFIGRLN